MRYFNHKMQLAMGYSRKNDALQKYFPENDKWGVNILFDDRGAYLYEICKLSRVTPNMATWTHYAQIQRLDDDTYEISSRFMGENENEMWIWTRRDRFCDAVEFIATSDFDKLKPIEIHLWSIEDAKDGDVLVASDKSIFIYDGSINENGNVGFHIALTKDMSVVLNSDDGCGWEEKDSCYPATKEQRDLLFQKMKEAGYEWNKDKKELIKL